MHLGGSAKKIYMSGKRSEKVSSVVVDEIRKELESSGLMDEKIETLLKGII